MTKDQTPRGDVFIATSLDGFIARPDGTLDWLTGRPAEEETGEHDPDQDFGYSAFLATVDALFMGRGTFDVVQGFEGDWPYPKPVYVWTSDPVAIQPKPGADVRPVSGELDEALDRLRADGIRQVYVDGGATIRAWLDAGLVDHMTISTVPVLIGEGIPLFGGTRPDIALELERSEVFPGGMVQRTYAVRRTPN
ncbi:MAG TPA: dihydrofolate reductase family protein [Acidimicrobiales bacterium]|nr:dihydrofolate reductase family protein [Acidimicrobiales bacterium]